MDYTRLHPEAERTIRAFWGAMSTTEQMMLAERCQVNFKYLRNLVYSKRRPTLDMARKMMKFSNGFLKPENMFPELWDLSDLD